MIEIFLNVLQTLKRFFLRDRAARAAAEQPEGSNVQGEVAADIEAIEAEMQRKPSGGGGHAP